MIYIIHRLFRPFRLCVPYTCLCVKCVCVWGGGGLPEDGSLPLVRLSSVAVLLDLPAASPDGPGFFSSLTSSVKTSLTVFCMFSNAFRVETRSRGPDPSRAGSENTCVSPDRNFNTASTLAMFMEDLNALPCCMMLPDWFVSSGQRKSGLLIGCGGGQYGSLHAVVRKCLLTSQVVWGRLLQGLCSQD